MKKLLALMLALTASLMIASAQDIIVLKNSERIDAKIVNVSSTEISYKKASYLDGPTFTLNIAEVSSIIYANGEVQAFSDTPAPAPEPQQQPAYNSTYSDMNSNAAVNNSVQRSGGLKFNPQPQGKKRTFGISIGYTSKQMVEGSEKMPWVNAEYMMTGKEKESSPALKVGLYWAPEFKYGIGIQTGLYYEMSSSKFTDNGEYGDGISLKCSEHTLSIPLRIQYRYEIIKDLSVFLYTGPSFDISMAYTATIGADGYSEKINMYDKENGFIEPYKRFNMLWGVGGGVRWKGLQLMLGGDWGLTKIVDNYDVKLNKPFFITVSYLF